VPLVICITFARIMWRLQLTPGPSEFTWMEIFVQLLTILCGMFYHFMVITPL